MQDFGRYILGVGLAALLVGILAEFSDEKSSIGMLTRMVCGLFLAFTVITPLADLNFDILESFAQNDVQIVQPVVSAGTALAEETMAQIIKQEVTAYILDKASSLGCIVDAEVTVGEGLYPVPESVCITGDISPQKQIELETYLEKDLGIAKENQQWIG